MKRLFSDTIVYGFSNIVSKLINLFLLPIYAFEFSISEYGILSIFIVFMAVLSQLSLLQLDSAAFRFITITSSKTEKETTYSTWFFTEFSISLIFLLLTLIFSSQLSTLLFDNESYSFLLILSVISFPINTIEYICLSDWRINSRKWHVSIVNLLGAVVQIILTYSLITHFKLGISSVIIASLITSILKSFVCSFYILKYLKIKAFCRKHLNNLFAYCLPFIPAGISLWIITFIDRIFLEKMIGTESVGYYQMGNTLSSIILLPIGAFLFAWSPFVFSIINDPNHKEKISKIVELFTIGISVIGFICCIFSSEALYFFSAPKYFSSISIVPILIFANIGMGLYQLSGVGASIAKKTRPVMYATILGSIINVVLNIIFIPEYGIYGASIATLISYCFIPIFLFAFSQKHYRLPFRFNIIAVSFLFFLVLSILSLTVSENFTIDLSIIFYKIVITLVIVVVFILYIKRQSIYFK